MAFEIGANALGQIRNTALVEESSSSKLGTT